MKIYMGADHRGAEVLSHLRDVLTQSGHEVALVEQREDGICDYPDTAYPVAVKVANGSADRGILICGTGIGMSIAANKVDGIRAAVVHDEISADMSRRHNDANILCLPADLLGNIMVAKIVETWLETEFDGGRHARRVNKVHAIERGIDPATISDTLNEQDVSVA
jgi:ribose 5-phosphate isomerase B